MGRFERLRSKAMSLRGAVAFAGAAVIAVSMAQASGTLAASEETRTAKMEVVSQNYFPTPLPDKNGQGFNGVGINCESLGSGLQVRRARVSWPSVGTGYRYKVRQVRVNSNGEETWSDEEWTGGTSIELNYAWIAATTTQVHVYVVNAASGTADSSRATSSGYVGTNIYTPSGSLTRCTDPKDYYRVDNQRWEDQHEWTPGVIPFATTPAPSVFAALFDADASGDPLGELPEGDQLTSLSGATLDAEPGTPEGPTNPAAPSASRVRAAGPTPTASTSPSVDVNERSAVESATEVSPSPSVPVSLSLQTSSRGATPSPSTATTSSPSSASTPTTTVTTARPTVKAGVGDYPIPVGEAFARLEDVDGRTHLILSRGGAEVCSADVDGASRIEETNGELTVTVAGRTSKVDSETCELT